MPLVNPIISRVAPIKVGGSANAGAGFLASAFDHVHPLTETSGPTDLGMSDVLDQELIRRVGSLLTGLQFDTRRTTGTNTRSVTALGDVDPAQASFDLKAGKEYLTAWMVFYNTAVATTGLILSLNFTGTITQWRYGLFGATGATTMQSAVAATSDAPLGAAGTGPGTSDRVALLFSMLRVTNAGNLALRYASGVASSTVTILSGTHGWNLQR